MANAVSMDEYLAQENHAENAVCDIILEAIRTRKYKQMSQEDLAAKAGVSIEDLNHFESFILAKVSLDAFAKILFALEIKPEIH